MIRRLALLFCFAVGAHAADPAPTLRSERITVEHGLPDLRLFTASQDRDGMLWIGSRSGLFRYDGYRVDVIDDRRVHRFGDRPLLASNVGRVHVDRHNRVWAMSWGAGMNRLDLDDGRMHHFRFEAGVAGSLSSPYAQVVFEDRAGRLWIGTGNGLNRFDEDRGGFELLRATPPLDPLDARVWTVVEDEAGALWIGTAGGLERFDPAQAAWPLPVAIDGLDGQTVRLLHFDRFGRLWAATPTRFGRVDLARARFEPVPLPAAIASVRVSDAWEDDDGHRLWLVTEAGLLRVDLGQGRFLPFADGDYRLFPGDDFRDVLVDRGGVVWLATHEQGLLKLRDTGHAVRLVDTVPADVSEGHGFGQVNAVASAADGRLWIATARGLLLGHADAGGVERAADVFGRSELALAYLSITVGRDGSLWLAGTDGVRRFDPASGAIDDLAPRMRAHGAVDVRSNAVLEDRFGQVWIGTHRHGLFRLSADRSALDRVEPDRGQAPVLGANQVSRLLEDRLGRLWVGTQAGGLALMIPGSDTMVAYEPWGDAAKQSGGVAEVSALYHARDGRLWVGGGVGVRVLSLATGRFEDVATPQALGTLLMADFFEDVDGHVWGVFLDRIARLPAATGGTGARRFEDRHGRAFLFREAAGATQPDGTRLLGGHAGLLALRVDSLGGDVPAAPTSITRVLLDHHEQRLGGALPAIVLGPGHGTLAIEFALADFRSPRLNQFRYRMAGLDSHWLDIGAERSARFSHLPAGDYVFEVEGSGPEGVWSEQPARLRIRVLPPWWADPRALGALLLLLAVVGVAAFRLHLYRVRRRHDELQRVIDTRTRALLRQREELEAMDQMVRAVNRQVSPEEVLREAILQGLALFPAGVRGSALWRAPGSPRLAVVTMVGYTLVEQDGRFGDRRIDPDRLGDGGELAPGLHLLHARQQHGMVADAARAPAATLVLSIELDGAPAAALLIDHYQNAAVFDDVDVAALSRYREHVAGALGNAVLMQRLAAQRARAEHVEQARLQGDFNRVLADSLDTPLHAADVAGQELEVDVAQLERDIGAGGSDGGRAAVSRLRRHLRQLARAISELRDIVRRLRHADTAAAMVPTEPVAQLAAALQRLRAAHGNRIEIETDFAREPTVPGLPDALDIVFERLLAAIVDGFDGEPPLRLHAGSRVEGDRLRITIDAAGGGDIGTGLDQALIASVIDRHGGRLGREAGRDGRHWCIELPLSSEPAGAAAASSPQAVDTSI